MLTTDSHGGGKHGHLWGRQLGDIDRGLNAGEDIEGLGIFPGLHQGHSLRHPENKLIRIPRHPRPELIKIDRLAHKQALVIEIILQHEITRHRRRGRSQLQHPQDLCRIMSAPQPIGQCPESDLRG